MFSERKYLILRSKREAVEKELGFSRSSFNSDVPMTLSYSAFAAQPEVPSKYTEREAGMLTPSGLIMPPVDASLPSKGPSSLFAYCTVYCVDIFVFAEAARNGGVPSHPNSSSEYSSCVCLSLLFLCDE